MDELLNLGLLALEAGDFATAQSALSQADILAEERLTKSLSREAAGMAVSDRVRAYQGTAMDKALIHYYRALAFLGQNDLSSAVVEGRRIASYLEVTARESKHAYKDDAYLQWFSGSLYESFGQVNDAWISYKRARELYARFLRRSRAVLSLPRHARRRRGRWGTTSRKRNWKNSAPTPAAQLKPGYGRVVVICETGIAPPILERNLVFPIYTSDNTNWADDEARWRYAGEVSRRGDGYYGDNVKLKYLLRIAMPYYPDDAFGHGRGRRRGARRDSAEVRAELAAEHRARCCGRI